MKKKKAPVKALCITVVLVIAVLTMWVNGQPPSVKSGAAVEKIALRPCEVGGAEPNTKLNVLCGTLEVYKDRARGAGRKIPINIVVFPATGKGKLPDPVFYMAGGPGSAATEDAPYVAAGMAKVRERRDL